MAESSRSDPGVVAQRLDHLFRTVHPKNRGAYTYQEVADGINVAAGEKVISPSYLWQLRKGTRAEPSHSRLAAIARFFGVPLTYFTDDETAHETDEQLELLVALRDQGVQHLAMRAAGLSAESLQAILAMIENARKIEKLPEEPA